MFWEGFYHSGRGEECGGVVGGASLPFPSSPFLRGGGRPVNVSVNTKFEGGYPDDYFGRKPILEEEGRPALEWV